MYCTTAPWKTASKGSVYSGKRSLIIDFNEHRSFDIDTHGKLHSLAVWITNFKFLRFYTLINLGNSAV